MVIGYWLFVIGYWLFVIGYWLFVIGYWLFVIGYWLFVILGFLLIFSSPSEPLITGFRVKKIILIPWLLTPRFLKQEFGELGIR